MTSNTIKHLVISGGSVNGLFMYGALKHCHQQNMWKHSNLTSIYATSVGSILATILCLDFDWETVDNYLVHRPWQNVFSVTGELLFGAYAQKGLFNADLITEIFKPLFAAKELSLKTTFAEFYARFPIDLHFFSFDLNAFVPVDISHATFPDLPVLTGIAMSSALPGMFAPVFLPDVLGKDKCCFIDGGIRLNYPVSECLRQHPDDLENILGVTVQITKAQPDKNTNKNEDSHITKDSNILEYFIEFASKINQFINSLAEKVELPHEIRCASCVDVFDFDTYRQIIESSDLRKEWIEKGEKDAEKQRLEFVKNK
jgi:predicted acylesterase/phospholipase RssA